MAGSGDHAPKGTVANNEVADVLEERLIDAEYKIWKKNTPYLYDIVMTHALEWPSLTCQWLPTVRNAGSHAMEHSLLLGTHTTGEQNYLMVASCNLPKYTAVIDNRTGAPSSDSATADATTPAQETHSTQAQNYDEEKREVGGFGHGSANLGKIEMRMKIKHKGEVNRARYMPQNHFIVATRGPDSDVYVFDLSKHQSFPAPDSLFCPQVVCKGHQSEGYGMAWSPLKQGLLLSGGFDNKVCLWDVQTALTGDARSGNEAQPLHTFQSHTDVVEDVDWHSKDPNMAISVSDDKCILVWDVREHSKPSHAVKDAHSRDINCVAFNPIDENTFATGSADKTVALWDIRNLKRRLHTLEGHTDEVYMVEWAPFNQSIVGSCGADRRVAIWDLSRIGMKQSPEDAEDGPPELLFLHGGHTNKVSDFSWNGKEHWTLSSVSEDNVLQVWSMAEDIYAADDDEGDDEEPSGTDSRMGDDDGRNSADKARAEGKT